MKLSIFWLFAFIPVTVQPISGRSSLIVEVLFDVLQDSRSPYEQWAPFVSIGVGVGI